MKSSIKLKHSKELEVLMKEPIKLSILVQIAFCMNEEGEAGSCFPSEWEKDIGELILVGQIEKTKGGYKILNKKIVDITLSRKPSKKTIDSQPLEGKIIVPYNLEEYYKIALSFKQLFLKNLKSIEGRTENVEKATFGGWVPPIRLMIEKDGVTVSQLREVWKFLDASEFWKDKVQSTAKLRTKFDTLYNQLKADARKEQANKGGGNKSGNESKVSTDYVNGVLSDLLGS